ncbi:MAG: hypothetical protein ACPL7K_09070, partial [Armatimonadota bacterium]
MNRSARLFGRLLPIFTVIAAAGVVCADMPSPLTVELEMPQYPAVGQEAVLNCTLASRFALKGVSLTIELPAGV